MKIAAEKEYGNALQLLTTAVADQQQAKNNATLAAVLMLAIFEVSHSACLVTPKLTSPRLSLVEVLALLLIGRIT